VRQAPPCPPPCGEGRSPKRSGGERGGGWSLRHVLAPLLLALFIVPASAQTTRAPDAPVKIEITARPIPAFEPRNPTRIEFGSLTFRGGMSLMSPNSEFGGISSLRVQADGQRFLAVTDKGRWLRGRITYDGTRPTGIADAEMAPVLGPDGKALAARNWYDTEAMAEDGGTVWLGIERVHRIVKFDIGRFGLLARGEPIPVPPGIGRLPNNKSIECLVFVPRRMPLGGTLIAISERGLDRDGNIQGFVIGGPSPGDFSVKRIGDFDISDCAVTPAGNLLLLERSFSRLTGVGMRIRSVPLTAVKPGATIDGPALIESDMGYQIDNMEGISVHRAPDGKLVLTLISDDNFSIIQRTILLQFTLAEP
jgi:hypothetical protein